MDCSGPSFRRALQGTVLEGPPTTLKRALRFWNDPELTPATHRQLLRFTQRALKDARSEKWKQVQYPVLAENALRQLIAMSPDLQTA